MVTAQSLEKPKKILPLAHAARDCSAGAGRRHSGPVGDCFAAGAEDLDEELPLFPCRRGECCGSSLTPPLSACRLLFSTGRQAPLKAVPRGGGTRGRQSQAGSLDLTRAVAVQVPEVSSHVKLQAVEAVRPSVTEVSEHTSDAVTNEGQVAFCEARPTDCMWDGWVGEDG